MNVSYGEVERAAIAILKSERRPTVETVREALGRGSPDTIGGFLKRVWRDLGIRMEGDPAALTRMPAEIADLADGLWQRALKLAAQSATDDNNAARERLEQIQLENDLKAQSLALRETEWDTAARAREKALADSRQHLLLTLKALGRDQATLQAREARIADLEAQVEHYRRQLAAVIAGAVTKHRARKRHQGQPAVRVVPARRPPAAPSRRRSRKATNAKPKTARRALKSTRKRKSAKKSRSGRRR
jgi:hypothetical protein